MCFNLDLLPTLDTDDTALAQTRSDYVADSGHVCAGLGTRDQGTWFSARIQLLRDRLLGWPGRPGSSKSGRVTSLRNRDRIRTGGTSETHIVGEGDRLSEIALNHGLSVQELLDINPQVLDPDVIYIGEVIVVPPRQIDLSNTLNSDSQIDLPSIVDAVIADAGATSGILLGSLRTWQEVRLAYEHSQKQNGLPSDYHTDGAWPWQCTAWAYVRWRELGRQGAIYSPSGRSWATANGGRPTNAPTLGAAASYKNGGHGHVMIVEQISVDFTQFRVSEMNVGDDLVRGIPTEYRSDQWFMSGPRQTWISRKTGISRKIMFAPVDGGRGSNKLR